MNRSMLITSTFALLVWAAGPGCGGGSNPGETCSDSTKNQNETDIDCGGLCTACATGKTCLIDDDCLSDNCVTGTCAPAGSETCNDGTRNQNETDIDCGGVCTGCANGDSCLVNGDCLSGNCANGTCAPAGGPTCNDGIRNQNETDIDCGGVCTGCANGSNCQINNDCTSLNCDNGTCVAAQVDQCPDDPNKTEPGICGCGRPDVDSDSDGTLDCNDGCPDDPNKIVPGQCGCGVADTDTDSDGTLDCNDGCPDDPLKVDPGACGCGTPDTDSDLDGTADCIDNCPDYSNPGQEDSNGDGVGDACQCGSDCWGPQGCLTAGGRCIRFTCRAGDAGPDFCQNCMGADWHEITYNDWLNAGYCSDIIATYRSELGTTTLCEGDTQECCSDPAACAGGDNAWHFHDGIDNHYVGPCLGCPGDVNCTYWNGTDNSTYTRLTACQRPAASAVLLQIGNVASLPSDSGHSPNFLLGSQLTVPQNSTLLNLAVIGRAAGPQVKLALYTEVGGEPAALVAQTPATPLVAGVQEIPVTPVALPAGNYWIMGNYDISASIGFESGGGWVVKYISLPFADPLPANYPAPTTYTDQRFNYYITVRIP